ncbi:MAG: hypothetical protein KA761_00175 [Gemmatimonadaceae bacterium]|nr:hypothetical protein [Gemmatimonadaceae bacterium]
MDLEAIAASAQRLIRNAGVAVTFTRATVTQAQDGSATETTSTVSLWSVATPIGKSDELRVPDLARRSIVKLVVEAPPGTVAPAPGDRFPWRGRTYSIVNVDDIAPAGSSIVFTVYAEAA